MSDIISVKTLGRFAGASLIALSLGACSQMMKHSNTLVFATNTTSGLKVGTDSKQVPMVQIGHSRQEFAFVPVLANTGPASGKGSLVPCEKDKVQECKFIGTHDGTNKDSYSTLASFGSKTDASVDKDGKVAGTVAIAQYFATGIAAQYLAVTGGANIVSAGGDTKAKADATIAGGKAIKDAEIAKAAAANQKIRSGYSVALVIMGNDPNAAVTDSMMDALEAAIHTNGCTKAKFKARSYPMGSVESFLDKLNKDNPTCLIKLIPSA